MIFPCIHTDLAALSLDDCLQQGDLDGLQVGDIIKRQVAETCLWLWVAQSMLLTPHEQTTRKNVIQTVKP